MHDSYLPTFLILSLPNIFKRTVVSIYPYDDIDIDRDRERERETVIYCALLSSLARKALSSAFNSADASCCSQWLAFGTTTSVCLPQARSAAQSVRLRYLVEEEKMVQGLRNTSHLLVTQNENRGRHSQRGRSSNKWSQNARSSEPRIMRQGS